MANVTKLKFKTNKDKTDSIHNGRKCVMLAHGESGHAHAFYGEDTVSFDGKQLIVKKSDSLDHEEHTSHEVHPGVADVTIQREYQMGVLRTVTD